ncbi:TetR/AcrR family transcriptional regulator [Candidatus Villigracilis affinis]|uniref:TetR/AcrR family transcriptional regulator n=1 Tax=Candidatus Villigracilis affinis TaxID=3140682 RepID=UPI002A1ABF39|nr:TetR/AcrR family transcriptional regulator [Anaerolineales bacterium]
MPKKVKPEDRRIQRTRQSLQTALSELIVEKGYEKVTVQDVIDRANVGRSTFYAHFESLDQLLLSGFEPLRMQFEDFLSGTTFDIESPWALSLAMFQQVQKQKGGYITLIHIQKFLYGYLLDHLKQGLPKRNKNIPPELLAHYVASTFIALMTWWIDNNYPIPAEKMNEIYRQLVEPGTMAIMMGA